MKKKRNQQIQNLYKPIRYQIANYNLIDSLFLIWGYSRNYTFDFEFPNNIEPLPGFSPTDDKFNRKYSGLLDFELEFLTREFVLHCPTHNTQNTLRERRRLIKLVKYVRDEFDNGLTKEFLKSYDILAEFHRLSHRQFKWQGTYNQTAILRYFKIYSNPDLAEILQNKFKMSTHQHFLIGAFFFYFTALNFRVSLPFKSTSKIFTTEMFEQFLDNFAITLEDARKEIKKHHRIDDAIYYTYNPIAARPIIVVKGTLVCPVHLLLFWQFTNGIYYLLYDQTGFSKAYGDAFEKYIGQLIAYFCSSKNFTQLAETKYGKQEKKSCDWILVDKNAVLFIECKTKRMTLASKSEADIKQGLEQDLKIISDAILQLYKNYIAYSSGKFPHLAFNSQKKFFPLLLTLEPWYINANPKITIMLKDYVIENFRTAKIDLALLEKYPYYIFSCQEFEYEIQLINKLGIANYFDKLASNTIVTYKEKFDFKPAFDEEYQKYFLDEIQKMKNEEAELNGR